MMKLILSLLITGASAAPAWPYSCAAGENVTSERFSLAGQVWVVTGADGRLGYRVRVTEPHPCCPDRFPIVRRVLARDNIPALL